jgi:hypothetical protein
VTASFVGFTISSAPPAASATLVPDSGRITGPLCNRGSLYGVINYSGPGAASFDGSTFGPGGSYAIKQPVQQGRNVLLMFKKPANGSYSVKLGVSSTVGASLTGTTVFAPAVTINC